MSDHGQGGRDRGHDPAPEHDKRKDPLPSEPPLSPCWYNGERGDYVHVMDGGTQMARYGYKRLPRSFDHAFDGGEPLRAGWVQWEPEMGFDVVAPWPPEDGVG